MLMECPDCRNTVPDYHSLCPGCGSPRPAEKVPCPRCGRPAERTRYCAYCGHQVFPPPQTENVVPVRVLRDGRATGMGGYTEYWLYSIRQRRELKPRTEFSGTGTHWTHEWLLTPGEYVEACYDRTNSAKVTVSVNRLVVTPERQEREPLDAAELPEWLRALLPACVRKRVVEPKVEF